MLIQSSPSSLAAGLGGLTKKIYFLEKQVRMNWRQVGSEE